MDDKKMPERTAPHGLELFLRLSTTFSQVVLWTTLGFLLVIELWPILVYARYVFWVDIFIVLVIWGTIAVGFGFWTAFTYRTWFGQLFAILGHVAAFLVLNNLMLKEERFFPLFPISAGLFWGLAGFMVLGVLMNLLNFLFFFPVFRRKEYGSVKKYGSAVKQSLHQKARPIITMMIVSITLGLAAYAVTLPQVWNLKITITPQDYQAEIAFWADHHPELYTPVQRESLNAHHATIIHYTTPNIRVPIYREWYIDNLTYWKLFYPNVKIMAAIPGLPGGFVWDGCAKGTTDYAKEYITMAITENLTNFIGISIDMETPIAESLEPYNVTSEASRERHEESVQIWNDFFDWRDVNAPTMKVQLVNYVSTAVDTFDGDNDVQVIETFNSFELDGWNEVSPMIYRCGYRGTKPYGDYPETRPEDESPDHFWMYTQMNLLTNAVEAKWGDRSRLGVYLGITNCTCYGADVDQTEHGKPAGRGFDALVRDALIAKHFGAPIITVFILNTVIENGYSMGGVFDSYGDSFLDDFMLAINGPNSTKPFEIYYTPEFNDGRMTMDMYVWLLNDFIFSLNNAVGIILVCLLATANTFLFINLNKKIDSSSDAAIPPKNNI